MTDTRLGRSPRSEAELVREFDRRLKALERSQTARIGPWVLSAPDGRLLATRPGEAALEVGQPPTPEVVDLSSRGSVVSDMNTADLANAVGMPDVDPEAPPTIDQIRQWMVTNLFGPVAPGRIQQLPWAHLGGGTAELLDDPGFDSSATFNAGDPNITRNAEFGRSKPGSAQIVANGAAHLVVSNLIAVEQGEKLPVGVWVFYEELVASAAPVRVSVRAYHRNADDSLTLLSTTQVAALTATSGESADHPDQDDDWVWLGGTYAVPGPVGGLTVTDVVLEAKVTEDATGGTINVDDATVTKTRDGLPQDWILNLVPDLASVWNGVAGTVETIMTSLGLTPSGTFWDDLFDLSDEIAWIQDKANDAGADAAAALADLASKLGISDWDNWLSSTWDGFKATLLTNPGSLLGMLGMNKITDLPALNTDFVALQNILSGAATTPPTTLLQQVKDWWSLTQQKTQHLSSGGTLPPTRVSGVGGAPNIGQALEDTWNKFWDGIHGLTGSTGKTADDVQTAAAKTANDAVSASNAAQTATSLATYSGGRPIWEAANPTLDTAILESALGVGSTPANFQVTQTASALGFVRTRNAQDKTIVQWIGRGNSLTTAKLHVYRLNTTTGDLAWVQTKNITPASLPTAAAFGRVIIELDAPVHMEPGDVLALEVCVTGGTHDIAGINIGWYDPDDSAIPKGPSASRNSGTESAAPTTILAADIGYNGKVPYIGAGIPQGELPPPSLAYYFTDTFNSLSAWTILSGSWQANSGSAVNPTGNPGFLLYNNSVLTDRARASFTMPGIKGGSFGTGFSSGSVIRFFMLADSTGANGIAFEVESNGAGAAFTVRLVSFIGGVRTVRATTSATIPDGSTMHAPSISYDPDTKTYRASHMTGSLMEWTDSGNLMPHGPDYRRLLLFSDFGNVSNPGPEYSGVCASITYYDVT